MLNMLLKILNASWERKLLVKYFNQDLINLLEVHHSLIHAWLELKRGKFYCAGDTV